MWKSEYAVVRRTSPVGIPLVRLSFLLVSHDRTSEISNPAPCVSEVIPNEMCDPNWYTSEVTAKHNKTKQHGMNCIL